jgi:hypothetical protein
MVRYRFVDTCEPVTLHAVNGGKDFGIVREQNLSPLRNVVEKNEDSNKSVYVVGFRCPPLYRCPLMARCLLTCSLLAKVYTR